MKPLDLFAADFAARLPAAGFKSFDDFWRLEWNWVEPRNERRKGWSGATRVRIETAEGPLSLFVKRQENHCYRSIYHPLKGRPTFYREWIGIQRLRAAGIPTLDPVYYGERVYEGRSQAVLVSLALDDFRDLNEVFRARENLGEEQREEILKTLAAMFVRFHRSGLIHNCLSGSHLMLRFDEEGRPEARLLDLEKLKSTRNIHRAAGRDLARFIRHTPTLLPQDHLSLMLAYGEAFPAGETRRLVDAVNVALHDKHARRGRAAHSLPVPD
jgi:hypothetical protein